MEASQQQEPVKDLSALQSKADDYAELKDHEMTKPKVTDDKSDPKGEEGKKEDKLEEYSVETFFVDVFDTLAKLFTTSSLYLLITMFVLLFLHMTGLPALTAGFLMLGIGITFSTSRKVLNSQHGIQ